jgi:hypothetical protein
MTYLADTVRHSACFVPLQEEPPIAAGRGLMALFKKTESTKRNDSRVVVTGKRVKGVWQMESALPLSGSRRKTGKGAEAILETRNRRVRTLH